MIKSARGRVFVGLIAGLASLGVLVAFLQRRVGYYRGVPESSAPLAPIRSTTPIPDPSAGPTSQQPESRANPTIPSPESTILPESKQVSKILPSPPFGFVGTLNLIVPVAGVKADQLRDTFGEARSEGRVHDAIDISAPLGTPVVAAADGEILKLFQSDRGGVTIYQLNTDKKLVFYYAHLQRYADGLFEGKFVRQGEAIGHVGDSGNAGPGNYHLHFSIMVISDPKRYWEGLNVNPYPLLRR